MKCHEARKFIGPYLDSELDTKTSLEIEQHIEECAECNRLFKAEEKLDERTFAALRQGGRTPSLWAAVESGIQPRPSRRLFGWKPLVALGGLTAAVVILGVILLQQRTGHQSDLAVVAEERHHEYANQKVAPEFTGKVPDAVAQKLGNRLDMSAFAYSVADADFSTQGARVCDIAGVPAAWILGSYKGTPVSMIVFKENEIGAFAEVQKRFRSGESLVDCGNGHCEIVVRILNGHVVCLVADLPKSTMRNLAMSVQPTSQPLASLVSSLP